MTKAATAPACQPFFLPAAPGERFCVYFPPAAPVCRANVLHVHAFGEELNKSRRMVSLQARALTKLGLGVLLVDLYGCGDSSGDFGDARWEIWRDDIERAANWLGRREEAPVVLWGLRLGALLMMDFAKDAGAAFRSLLMWQPVQSGETYLSQFLRLRVANDMLASGKAKVGTRELKERLKAGEPLEIAGYELAPALARAIDERRLVDLPIAGSVLHWLEVVSGGAGSVSPASRRVLDDWASHGLETSLGVVAGEPFWTTQEITECRSLIEVTSRIFAPNPA